MVKIVSNILSRSPQETLFFLSLLMVPLFTFFYNWARLWRAVRRLQRGVQNVTAEIDAAGKDSDAAARDAIGRQMDLNGFARPWQRFSASLVKFEFEPGRLVAGDPPEQDFNRDALAAHTLKLRHQAALPNILLGLGLLVTFLGLIQALMSSAESLASSDLQGSMFALLSAAGVKFIASIIGLLLSILYSVLLNKARHDIDEQSARLCAALHFRFPLLSPYLLLGRSEQRLASIAETAETLVSVMDGMADRMQTVSQDALERMASQFSAALHDQAASQIAALADNVRDLGGTIGGMSGTLTKAGTELATSTTDAADAMLSAARQSDSVMRAAAQDAATVTAALKDMVGVVAATLETAAATTKETSRTLQTDLTRAASKLEKAMGRLAGLAEDASAATLGATATLDGARTTLQEAEQRHLDGTAARLDAMAAQAGNADVVFQQLGTAHTLHAASVAGQIAAMKITADETSGILSEVLAASARAATMLQDAQDRHLDSIKEEASRVSDMGQSASAAAAAIAKALTSSQEGLLRVQQTLAEHVEGQAVAMAKHARQVAQALDDSSGKAAAVLASAGDALGRSIGQASDRLDGVAPRWADIGETLGNGAAQVTGAGAALSTAGKDVHAAAAEVGRAAAALKLAAAGVVAKTEA